MDLEPVYTMRGHSGAVLSLAVSPTGEYCYSGGIDGTLCCWNIPNMSVDPYDAYGNVLLYFHFLMFFTFRYKSVFLYVISIVN